MIFKPSNPVASCKERKVAPPCNYVTIVVFELVRGLLPGS